MKSARKTTTAKGSEPWGSRRIAAEHAASELASRGAWICQCRSCEELRVSSAAAIVNGFCPICSMPLIGRRSKRYCNNNCRQLAFHKRRRQKRGEAIPLFASA
jgi:predicted nucleic acid-binding Zn ribbon protein